HTLMVAVAACLVHVALILAPEVKHLAPSLLQLTGASPFVAAFLVGAVLHCFHSELVTGRAAAVLWTLVALVLLKLGGWNLLGPLVLPMSLINIAYSFHFRLRHDFSYGVYIFHFPVMQAMSAYGLPKLGYWGYFSVALIVTVICAALSWFAVERPCLRLK
ncbi:MAG: hypothetical protein ACKOTE_05605, partial [Opitutaceae bacterium]